MNRKVLSALVVVGVALVAVVGCRKATQASPALSRESASSSASGPDLPIPAPDLPKPKLRVSARDVVAPADSGFAAPAAQVPAALELAEAIEEGKVEASFSGNGRDKMIGTFKSLSNDPLVVHLEFGHVLQSGANRVVVVRAANVNLPPKQIGTMSIQTLAPSSANMVRSNVYTLAADRVPVLDQLILYAQSHVEVSIEALQTAALAITENLPLSAVAKFTPAGEFKSQFNTDAFRVEPIDIIGALSALRQMGIPEESIAMTIDQQLRIEAMVEPLSRAAAMRYYRISASKEWEFWKEELLNGAPATRHYALYGIARFYPEVALEMLPKWAREVKTSSVYRMAALQALADTQKPEALPLLQLLSDELGADTELGRTALGAKEYLAQRLAKTAKRQESVIFRSSQNFLKF